MPEYILAKINDYSIDDYPLKLNAMIERLAEIIKSHHFSAEISRFIPMDIQERTLGRDIFKEFLTNEIKELLLETKGVVRLSRD